MSRPGWNGHFATRSRSLAGLALLILNAAFVAPAIAQQATAPPSSPMPSARPVFNPTEPMPAAVLEGTPVIPLESSEAQMAGPVLSPDVQVVRFRAPEGTMVEVLGPTPVPVPQGDGGGQLTVGLRRGIGYRLRISNIPERVGVEVFPVIEIVGHLHRPPSIDPGKYPVRVNFSLEELDLVIKLNRLVTKVVYLEDPDQALPFRLPKDQIPTVELNPTESPLRVAAALGRPMAIVRVGGRRPTIEEVEGGPGDLGLDHAAGMGASACPYLLQDGTRCPMVAGPPCTAPSARPRTLLPRDEFLCDGGDRGLPVAASADGGLGGIEPRDAAIRFDIGIGPRIQARALPTNVVCIYAPRFAEVRVANGAHATIDVQHLRTDVSREKVDMATSKAGSRRLLQNQSAELARNRSRASGFKGRLYVDEKSNRRIAGGFNNATQVVSNVQRQQAEMAGRLQQTVEAHNRIRLDGIKTAESPIVTGEAQSAGQTITVWGTHDMTGVETPPNRPGLAVIKRVSVAEAEPGDTVTYTIFYRNMGNTPIRSVAIADSLLPRLEYLKGTSRGPAGTAFTAEVNRVGSTELRWVLPGVLKPGASGHVSFNVIVR